MHLKILQQIRICRGLTQIDGDEVHKSSLPTIFNIL